MHADTDRSQSEPTAKDLAIASVATSDRRLVRLGPAPVHWVPSRYNARVTTSDGVLVLYNSYTGAVSGFPEPHAEQVCKLLDQAGFTEPQESLSKLKAYLVERGFVIPQDTSELQRFRHRYAQGQHQPDTLELILLTSEECNFRCIYCYESFPRGTMEPWVQEATIGLIKARIPRLNRLQLSYFGGEPLLGIEAIRNIAPVAKDAAQSAGVRYSSSITTNGYLLDSNTLDELIEYGVSSYQISLDGFRECHDHNRPLKDGGNTYERIYQNLLSMHRSKHEFMATIRVNFDAVNLSKMPEFLDEINGLRDDRRFKIRFFPVGKWGGPNDDELAVCGLNSEREKRKLDVYASELGYRTEGRLPYITPRSGSNVCYAARPYNLIIGADGKLMKCTVVLDTRDYNIVGHLTPDGRADISVDKLIAWTAPYFEDDEVCKQCFFLPVCQGVSCPLPRIETGSRPCPSEKLEIGPTLMGVWNEKNEVRYRYSLNRNERIAIPPRPHDLGGQSSRSTHNKAE